VIIADDRTDVGTVITPVTVNGGSFSAASSFTPVGAGTATLKATAPSGFSTPSQFATVHAIVNKPNIVIDDGSLIGKNLEQQATLFLGAPAPAGGISVTLSVTSGALQLSTTATGAGASAISVIVPEGSFSGTYFMYGTGSSGSATVMATATGYNTKTATENLAPSGIVVYGPFGVGFPMSTGLAAGPVAVSVSTAVLDPNTSAYLAKQPLAGAAGLQVTLNSGTPATGSIQTPVTIAGGTDTTTSQFTPLAAGNTMITAPPPGGYVAPSSGGALMITVTP
jgi:hypothetical protein